MAKPEFDRDKVEQLIRFALHRARYHSKKNDFDMSDVIVDETFKEAATMGKSVFKMLPNLDEKDLAFILEALKEMAANRRARAARPEPVGSSAAQFIEDAEYAQHMYDRLDAEREDCMQEFDSVWEGTLGPKT